MEKLQAHFLMAICGSVREDIQSCFQIRSCLIGQIVLRQQEQKSKNTEQEIVF